jgi:hypothetical protein
MREVRRCQAGESSPEPPQDHGDEREVEKDGDEQAREHGSPPGTVLVGEAVSTASPSVTGWDGPSFSSAI